MTTPSTSPLSFFWRNSNNPVSPGGKPSNVYLTRKMISCNQSSRILSHHLGHFYLRKYPRYHTGWKIGLLMKSWKIIKLNFLFPKIENNSTKNWVLLQCVNPKYLNNYSASLASLPIFGLNYVQKYVCFLSGYAFINFRCVDISWSYFFVSASVLPPYTLIQIPTFCLKIYFSEKSIPKKFKVWGNPQKIWISEQKVGFLYQCAPLGSLFIIRRCVDYTQTNAELRSYQKIHRF